MQAQDVNQAMVRSAIEELQGVIADQESEIQQLLSDLRRAGGKLGELPESSDVTDEAVGDLRWTVDSVRTELQEARQVLRGALDRVSEAAVSLR
jgi:uncharacterized coiled-coil protein SlyX